jgi:D-amino-acid dehydrogenase
MLSPNTAITLREAETGVADRYDALVLGAGVVGVNTAYFLAKAGKSVCVIDRQPRAGLETSFANGGQVSVSHAEPWANPSAPSKILKWLFDDQAPLLFRPTLDWHQWRWILSFLWNCRPDQADRNTRKIIQLATESRRLIRQIRAEERIEYDVRQKGILHFYRDRREFDSAVRTAQLMRRFGCDRQVINIDRVVEIEPAFARSRADIVGATYTADDESGDAFKYTQQLAAVCEMRGVDFLYGSTVVALDADRRLREIRSVEVRTPTGYRRISADAIVVALGSWSPVLLRPYGISLNVYPAKGYSVTIPIEDDTEAPITSLTDDQYKLVYSNLGNRLRIAGTAELSGYTSHLNMRRCLAIVDNVRALFPRAGVFEKATFWTGLRPTTPSNVPYVGRTGYHNLWLNTGHGTLGWTMGAGSGKRISDMIVAADGPLAA